MVVVKQYDAYGNVTNQVFAGWSEWERVADGSLVFRTYDAENNLVREVVRKGRTDTVTFPATNAASSVDGRAVLDSPTSSVDGRAVLGQPAAVTP